MSFRMIEKQNGGYVNLTPDFKSMSIGEELTIIPMQVLKTGTASKDGRSWSWKLFKFLINGQECAGFAPASFMASEFEERLGEELVIFKEVYKDKNKNDQVGFRIKKDKSAGGVKPGLELPSKKSEFLFKNDELSSEGEVYSEKEVVEFIKAQGSFDDELMFVDTWKKYGSSEERGREVFKHRGEL